MQRLTSQLRPYILDYVYLEEFEVVEPNLSPFYQDWEDKEAAARIQLYARELFDQYRFLQISSRAGHLEYGKWLIASLLAVHGGAIYAISGLTKMSTQST